MSPLVWMRAVRDAVPRFNPSGLAALVLLALRMDANGRGFVSHRIVAADAGIGVRTAERATAAARMRGYLVQTRRGHRLGNGVVVASEWCLSQPATVDGLRQAQPVTAGGLSESQPAKSASQPATSGGPRAPTTRAPAASSARDVVQHYTDATDEEAEALADAIVREPRPEPIRSLPAFLRRIGEDGDLKERLRVLRAERAQSATDDAYRRGWHCRCGTRNRVESIACRQCREPRAVAS